MFICKDCYMKTATDSFWWEIAPKSKGRCEECELGDVCADIHHSKIPIKKEKKERNSYVHNSKYGIW